MKGLALVVLLAVGTLLGCGDAETASTDTAITETIAAEGEETTQEAETPETASTAEPAAEGQADTVSGTSPEGGN